MNLKSNLYYDQTANPARRTPKTPRRQRRMPRRVRGAQPALRPARGQPSAERDATMDATPRPTATRGTRPAEAPRTTFVVRGSAVIGPRRASGSAPGLRYPLRIIHHGQARPSVAIVHRSSATTGRDSYILKTLDGLHRLAAQKMSAAVPAVYYAWLSMTYELTAVRGPCLGRCMYGRCAVYGGCGPRHRRCGPIRYCAVPVDPGLLEFRALSPLTV